MVSIIVELLLTNGSAHCIILVDVIQTPFFLDDCSSVCMRNELRHGTYECRSHENLDCPNHSSSKYFLTIHWIHTITLRTLLFYQLVVLYSYFTLIYDVFMV
jgi:hypothetical protein